MRLGRTSEILHGGGVRPEQVEAGPAIAAGASAPADAVFRFTAGEAMQTEDDDEDTGSEEYSDDKASD